MNSDGSGATMLTSPAENPSWSPDSERIVFDGYVTGTSGLFVMNADGSNVSALVTATASAFPSEPVWSPDGSHIAFSQYEGTGSRLLLMNADGSGISALTTGTANSGSRRPSWSPDGKKIVFQQDKDIPTESGLFVMNADGSNVSALITATASAMPAEPAWSADGAHIAFSLYDRKRYRSTDSRLFRMNADGSGISALTTGTVFGDDFRATWSPDGKEIAVSTGSADQPGIYGLNSDGTDIRQLYRSPDPIYDPAWSPDGKKIAFVVDSGT
jgi:TolB protein